MNARRLHLAIVGRASAAMGFVAGEGGGLDSAFGSFFTAEPPFDLEGRFVLSKRPALN